jgi:hypothetical protein
MKRDITCSVKWSINIALIVSFFTTIVTMFLATRLYVSLPIISTKLIEIGSEDTGHILLSTRTGFPLIYMTDQQGNVRVSIEVPPKGGPSIHMTSPDGEAAILIDTWREGNQPQISLYDVNTSKRFWKVYITEDGEIIQEATPPPVSTPTDG